MMITLLTLLATGGRGGRHSCRGDARVRSRRGLSERREVVIEETGYVTSEDRGDSAELEAALSRGAPPLAVNTTLEEFWILRRLGRYLFYALPVSQVDSRTSLGVAVKICPTLCCLSLLLPQTCGQHVLPSLGHCTTPVTRSNLGLQVILFLWS